MEGGPSLELLVGHALARVDEAGEVCDRLEAETKQAVHSLESRLQASAEATVQALEQRMSLALGGLRHSEVRRCAGPSCAEVATRRSFRGNI